MELCDVIFEDGDILVCYKPAGIATQTKKLGQPDMESILKNYRAQKGESPYVAVVHRLDQPVEGIMVFAKTQNAAAVLSRQIKERQIGKSYYAIGVKAKAEQNFETYTGLPSEGELTHYMMTDVRKNYSRIVDSKSPGAQRASLAYQVVAEKQQFVCLDIQLYTGRHHQIRLQMAHIGCPLLGDQKYGTGSGRTTLALCSYRMSFSHPRTGKRMEYCMKPKNESFKNIFTDENE